jgi:hypothetical protein
VETADSWKNKKVSKTSQVIGLYVKMARALKGEGGKVSQELQKQGAKIVKAIGSECARDKAMSNLKGKIKEIQALNKAA